MPKEEFISQEKFEELTKELDELRTTRRKEVAAQFCIAAARLSRAQHSFTPPTRLLTPQRLS